MSTDEAKRLGAEAKRLAKAYRTGEGVDLIKVKAEMDETIDRLVAMVQGVGKMREAISEAKDLMLRGETHAALGKLHAAEDAAPQQPQPNAFLETVQGVVVEAMKTPGKVVCVPPKVKAEFEKFYRGGPSEFDTLQPAEQAPGVSAAGEPVTGEILTREDVTAAREMILDCTGTDLLSGDRSAKRADRAWVYHKLLEAAGLLLGDFPSTTKDQT